MFINSIRACLNLYKSITLPRRQGLRSILPVSRTPGPPGGTLIRPRTPALTTRGGPRHGLQGTCRGAPRRRAARARVALKAARRAPPTPSARSATRCPPPGHGRAAPRAGRWRGARPAKSPSEAGWLLPSRLLPWLDNAPDPPGSCPAGSLPARSPGAPDPEHGDRADAGANLAPEHAVSAAVCCRARCRARRSVNDPWLAAAGGAALGEADERTETPLLVRLLGR